ncbi:MAG: NUDIX domain-containing protein [Alphaproteobacteria bacterium]|nr:NUDIX domain-containing protein [Alphaproteobacteria bacterium]
MIVRYLSFFFVLAFTISSNLYAGGRGAGILPMFDDGTVLVGKETRFSNKLKKNVQVWSDFGGAVDSKDKGDIAKTALRESNEETANTLRLTYKQVVNSPYTDHYHPTGGSYRMYYVRVPGHKPSLADFHKNARKLKWKSVEKSDWKYISAQHLLNAVNISSYAAICPGTNEEIFAPTRAGLKQRTAQSTLYNLINSVKNKPVPLAPKYVAKKPAPVVKRKVAPRKPAPIVKRKVAPRKSAPVAKGKVIAKKTAPTVRKTATSNRRKATPKRSVPLRRKGR